MQPKARFYVYVCVLAVTLAGMLVAAPAAVAQEHIVSPADLQNDQIDATKTRQMNQAKVEKFFNSDAAKKTLKSPGIDQKKVMQAVTQLDDEELARLAERTDKVQSDFAAGALSNQEITYIIIALVTAVIILVVVVA